MDLISRRAAIEAMCSACGYDCDKSEFVYNAPQDEQVILCPEHYALTQLPSARPEPQWIPVSEGLPEDCTEVFVYLFESPSPYIAWVEDTHWNTEDFEVDREDEPIAWMPLPEPWRAERRTDE